MSSMLNAWLFQLAFNINQKDSSLQASEVPAPIWQNPNHLQSEKMQKQDPQPHRTKKSF